MLKHQLKQIVNSTIQVMSIEIEDEQIYQLLKSQLKKEFKEFFSYAIRKDKVFDLKNLQEFLKYRNQLTSNYSDKEMIQQLEYLGFYKYFNGNWNYKSDDFLETLKDFIKSKTDNLGNNRKICFNDQLSYFKTLKNDISKQQNAGSNLVQYIDSNKKKKKSLNTYRTLQNQKNTIHFRSQAQIFTKNNANENSQSLKLITYQEEDTEQQDNKNSCINKKRQDFIKQRRTSKIVRHKIKELTPFEDVNTEQLKKHIQLINSFEFDVFSYSTQQQMEIAICHFQFGSTDFFKLFEIDIDRFQMFLQRVVFQYNKRNNSFHNFQHGLVVMHGSYFLTQIKRMKFQLSPLYKFALIFAGLCHDIDHRGMTNNFETKSRSKLSLVYNDISILENHHAYQTYKIAQQYNIFKDSKIDQEICKKLVVKMILSTDMSKHFKMIENFLQLKEKEKLQQPTSFKTEEDDEKQLEQTMEMMLHTADYFGNVQKFKTSRIWSELITDEFLNQYQKEESLNLPLTNTYKGIDRLLLFAKNEMGFINFIVLPLYKVMNKHLDYQLKEAVTNLETNLSKWQKIKDKEQESKANNYFKHIKSSNHKITEQDDEEEEIGIKFINLSNENSESESEKQVKSLKEIQISQNSSNIQFSSQSHSDSNTENVTSIVFK